MWINIGKRFMVLVWVLYRELLAKCPGALAKELSNINVATTIASHDCGTTKGHSLNLIGHDGREEIDVTDRYLAKDVTHNNLHIKAGTFVTPDLFRKDETCRRTKS